MPLRARWPPTSEACVRVTDWRRANARELLLKWQRTSERCRADHLIEVPRDAHESPSRRMYRYDTNRYGSILSARSYVENTTIIEKRPPYQILVYNSNCFYLESLTGYANYIELFFSTKAPARLLVDAIWHREETPESIWNWLN